MDEGEHTTMPACTHQHGIQAKACQALHSPCLLPPTRPGMSLVASHETLADDEMATEDVINAQP